METSTYTGTSPRGSAAVFEGVETVTGVSPYVPASYVTYPWTSVQHLQQQYVYPTVSPAAATYWAPETPRGDGGQCVFPNEGETEAIKAEAQRISRDALAVGTQVYGGVKSAVSSEATQGLLRSVGEMVVDAYGRLRGSRS